MTAILKAFALMSALISPLALAEGVEQDSRSDVSVALNKGEVDLHDVIVSFSSRTNKRILVDPRVRAIVTLVGLDVRDVDYPLLLRILSVHGFSAHEQGGVIEIVPDALARQIPSPLVSADKIRASDAEVVTAILQLKNISAAQLVPILRPLMPQVAHLAAFVDRNALIIVDQAANVRRMVAIAETLDRLPAVASPSVSSGDSKNE
jgi:general secretion pathway protein D